MAQARVAFGLVASQWGAPDVVVDAAYDDIVARYSEPHRRYHTLEHIGEVLDRVHGTEVELAAWYHDIIYDPAESNSEERSAAHAREALVRLGAPADVIAEVERLVLLTAGHEADDPRGRELIDADLSILTSGRARYERYVRDVRAEYAHVDDDEWRERRAEVLQKLRTVVDDDQARSNIAWELSALSSPQT